MAGDRIEAVTPLTTASPAFIDPMLGQIIGGLFVFKANSQWPLFPEEGEP